MPQRSVSILSVQLCVTGHHTSEASAKPRLVRRRGAPMKESRGRGLLDPPAGPRIELGRNRMETVFLQPGCRLSDALRKPAIVPRVAVLFCQGATTKLHHGGQCIPSCLCRAEPCAAAATAVSRVTAHDRGLTSDPATDLAWHLFSLRHLWIGRASRRRAGPPAPANASPYTSAAPHQRTVGPLLLPA